MELNIVIDRAQRDEQLIEEKYAKWMTQVNHEGDEYQIEYQKNVIKK